VEVVMPRDFQLEASAEPFRVTILYHWEPALSRKLPLPYQVEVEDAYCEVLWSGEIPKESAFVRFIRRPVPSVSVSYPVRIRLVAEDGTEQRATIDHEGAVPKVSAWLPARA
jgi:hypothetical protein